MDKPSLGVKLNIIINARRALTDYTGKCKLFKPDQKVQFKGIKPDEKRKTKAK
jgi:hypothetical protein